MISNHILKMCINSFLVAIFQRSFQISHVERKQFRNISMSLTYNPKRLKNYSCVKVFVVSGWSLLSDILIESAQTASPLATSRITKEVRCVQ